MRTTIELPDSVYRKGERIARAQGVTLQEFIVRTIEQEMTDELDTAHQSSRVTPPLMLSKEPGTLDLRDFNFDDLFA